MSNITITRTQAEKKLSELQRLIEDKRSTTTMEEVANVRGQIAIVRSLLDEDFEGLKKKAERERRGERPDSEAAKGGGMYGGV